MKKQIVFLAFLIFLGVFKTFSQTNEIQLRYNIWNRYEELFGASSYWFDYDEQNLSNKIITHPFRYHTITKLNNDDRYFNEEKFFRYFYLGLAYKKDSIFKKYFFKLRVDKFYFNGKASTTDNGWLTSAYNWKLCFYKTVISSMQITPGFGRSFNWKFLAIDIGIEIPLYFKGDEENYSSFAEYDSTGSNSGSSFYFTPGGYFIGIFLSVSLNVSISKHYSFGLDGSTGFIYANDYFWVKQGATRTRFIAHYPAFIFSYKF